MFLLHNLPPQDHQSRWHCSRSKLYQLCLQSPKSTSYTLYSRSTLLCEESRLPKPRAVPSSRPRRNCLVIRLWFECDSQHSSPVRKPFNRTSLETLAIVSSDILLTLLFSYFWYKALSEISSCSKFVIRPEFSNRSLPWTWAHYVTCLRI